MKPFAIQPRYLLPLTIFVAVLMVGLRTGDVWNAVTKGEVFSTVAHVQAEEKKPSKSEDPKPTAKEEKKAEEPRPEERPAPQNREPASPESDLYRQLLGRREQLDKRAGELDQREALIKVAEQRVDQKLQEMETLRGQLQSLVGQASEAQAAQLENLVKIYETMKPKEAARIFETLEMPILLGVVQRMKPARTAAVMAEMDPLKAKEITTALTKRDQLPQVK